MFHHYSENSSSTGEPPTPPSGNLSSNMQSASLSSGGNRGGTTDVSRSTTRDSSSGSLSVQEPDSGYEASPSSLADNTSSLHFFGEQTNQISQPHSSGQYSDEEIDFSDINSPILGYESESDLDEWDTCPDCNSAASCECTRTDSSTTNVTTAISICDNSSSRSNSSELSSTRPSSQPIQIPIQRSYRIRTNSIVADPQIDLRLQPARSQPMDFSRMQAFSYVSGSHPLSWPSTITAWRTRNGPYAFPMLLSNLSVCLDIPVVRDRLRRPNRHVRSRRQIIDSDASSSPCSSDGEGPEDVFNMGAEESASFPMCSMLTDSNPLPDVVLQSADSRRSRSISVNIPPEPELLRTIGITLRRFSDQFQIQREISMASRSRRRQTIGSISDMNGLS